jgi:membrane protein
VASEVKREIFSDHVLMVASGLAFHAMLAVLPVIAAIAAVWQIVADPAILEQALEQATGLLPPAMVELARNFITSVPDGFGLGVGLVLNLAFVLWTAQRSASGLISALNIAFDAKETRSRWRRALAGLGIAVGGVGYLLVSLATLALMPLLAPRMDATLLQQFAFLRWPLLGLAFFVGVGLLFSFGPCRKDPKWRPFTWGALAATLSWLLISFGLTVYVEYAGSFGQLYGSISSVVVALLWFYLSALSVLMGAEIDAALRQGKEGRRRSALKDQLRDSEKASHD